MTKLYLPHCVCDILYICTKIFNIYKYIISHWLGSVNQHVCKLKLIYIKYGCCINLKILYLSMVLKCLVYVLRLAYCILGIPLYCLYKVADPGSIHAALALFLVHWRYSFTASVYGKRKYTEVSKCAAFNIFFLSS